LDGRKLLAKAVENWPAKVLCIGLAIVLFVFNRMSTLEARFFSAPLNVEHLNTLMPSGSFSRMIRVSLRGEANSIYPIMEDDIEVYVDMEKFVSPGTYVVPVQWRKKGTALGVEPLQITVDPMEISLSLDYKISKFVPLAATFEGQVEAGYTMTSYSLNPTQVIVDGPAGLMGGISELYTESIDLNGRRNDFSVAVNILRRDPLIIIRGNGIAEFQGAVNQIVPVRNILNVPIVITGMKEGFTGELEIKAGNIHLESENQEAVAIFEPSPDFLKVDCSGISEPGTYILRVITGDTGNIKLRVEPVEVKIHINNAGDKQP
jgi:hypothetical protein